MAGAVHMPEHRRYFPQGSALRDREFAHPIERTGMEE